MLTSDARLPYLLLGDDLEVRLWRSVWRRKYLPAGTNISLTRLRDYQGREKAISEVLEYAEKSGVRNRIRDKIGTVCVELLMNALYDAPVDDRASASSSMSKPKIASSS